MIKEKINTFIARKNVPVYYDEFTDYSSYRTFKKKNKYLICDYCGEKIYINVPKHEKTGGIVKLSYVLTKSKNVDIALCNKCVKLALSEF